MADKAEIARQNRRRGKRVQKKINDKLGADNVGTLGGEDGKHSKFSIECKGLKKFVGEKYMMQAENNNVRKVIPLVVVHLVGSKYEDDLVMIRFKHFKKLIKL
jgi:hypothetical protein